MKRKALLCAALVLTLFCFSQSAAALLSNERSTEIEGKTRLPVINVTVPSSVNVMINPYEMPVSVNNGLYTDQIICSPAYLVSRSDVPLRVDVKVTGRVYDGSDLHLVSTPTNGTGTDKNAFIYFEMVKSSELYWGDVAWESGYANKPNQLLVTEGTSTSKQGVTILPVLGEWGLVPDNGYAWFRLAGDAVRNPTSEWNSGDGISVAVAFTFTPLPYSSNP